MLICSPLSFFFLFCTFSLLYAKEGLLGSHFILASELSLKPPAPNSFAADMTSYIHFDLWVSVLARLGPGQNQATAETEARCRSSISLYFIPSAVFLPFTAAPPCPFAARWKTGGPSPLPSIPLSFRQAVTVFLFSVRRFLKAGNRPPYSCSQCQSNRRLQKTQVMLDFNFRVIMWV